MVDLVKEKLPQLVGLCKKYQIAKLWLFGSATDPDRFHSESDLDFLYQFDDQDGYDDSFPYAANWSDLLDELKALFYREVQLIAYGHFENPYFQESVEATKQLIYDQDAEKVAV